jgi:hypothetical protein
VKKMLQEAQAKDAEEDPLYGAERRGDELPEELKDRRTRLARLKACKEQMEREAKEAAAEQEKKIAVRQAEQDATGQKKRGRKPKEPDSTPSGEAKANVTDPQSRSLKTRRGFILSDVGAGPDGTEASDPARPRPVQDAGSDDRAGVWAGEGSPRLRPVPTTGIHGGAERVELDLRDP